MGLYAMSTGQANRPVNIAYKYARVTFRTFAASRPSKRMFEKSWQIKTHGTLTRVRPSCLEAGVGKHSRRNMTASGLFKHPLRPSMWHSYKQTIEDRDQLGKHVWWVRHRGDCMIW